MATDILYGLYTGTLLWLLNRVQHRYHRLQSMIEFFFSMLPGEGAHLLLLFNAIGFYRFRHQLTTQWRRFLGFIHAYAMFRFGQVFLDNIASKYVFQEAVIRKHLLSPSKASSNIGRYSPWQWLMICSPIPTSIAVKAMYPGVRCIETRTFAHVGSRTSTPLQMDLYKHDNCGPKPPIFLFIHGGGWIVGNKSFAPQALVHQICSKGWLFCSIDYRLAPFSCFPHILIDCKRAIAYLRTATDLDADARTIVLSGESAGGHLSALMAVTSQVKSFQPGFEEVDTSVAGCVDTYGIHDFIDRYGHFQRRDNVSGFHRYIEVALIQKKFKSDIEAFEAASPLHYVLQGHPAPPFLMVHGEYDSVVPYEDSLEFYNALQAARQGPVPDIFIKVPRAQHAFNVFSSPRALAYGDTVVAFLDAILNKVHAQQAAQATQKGNFVILILKMPLKRKQSHFSTQRGNLLKKTREVDSITAETINTWALHPGAFAVALDEFDLNPNVSVTANELLQAQQILSQLTHLIMLGGGIAPDVLHSLSERFHALTQYPFKNELLRSLLQLEEKYEMVGVLYTRNIAQSIVCPSALSQQLKLLPRQENTTMLRALRSTMGKANAAITGIWSIESPMTMSQPSSTDTQQLLFHGTHRTAVAAILTSGLCVESSYVGGRTKFGQGIYLTNTMEKALDTVSKDLCSDGMGCVFIVETSLKRIKQVDAPGPHWTTAPRDFDSVMVCGATKPGTTRVVCGGVIPTGPLTYTSSRYSHDEFVVYDPSQVHVRYVVTFAL
ncbi:endomembrane protein 70 [Thraustotheca clavata]|uniref:Poly [ADP-ribose] polymerase n=1 Tax=Thraustotheca clavata TaxID=74557 RepID=A0A1W0A6W6_9STRA|nr:endomembrane protein 70 [Thraustotheca clavata]